MFKSDLRASEHLEQFVRKRVEGCYWFTGQHPDLPPWTYESDSVWGLCEYWLDKYDRTGDADCLRRAEADGWLGFLMICPKQLSWVANPTQTCHAEQTYYPQYSNYCYHDKKMECLARLGQLTKEPIFTRLCKRILQCQFWCQETTGACEGAQFERMADPWKRVSDEVNSKGSLYISELSVDAQLQSLEMGLVTNLARDDEESDGKTAK